MLYTTPTHYKREIHLFIYLYFIFISWVESMEIESKISVVCIRKNTKYISVNMLETRWDI